MRRSTGFCNAMLHEAYCTEVVYIEMTVFCFAEGQCKGWEPCHNPPPF